MNDIQEAIKKLCRDIQNSIDAGDKLRMSQAVCYLVLADLFNTRAEPEEVGRYCGDCKHYAKSAFVEPCRSCGHLLTNWEAATND